MLSLTDELPICSTVIFQAKQQSHSEHCLGMHRGESSRKHFLDIGTMDNIRPAAQIQEQNKDRLSHVLLCIQGQPKDSGQGGLMSF